LIPFLKNKSKLKENLSSSMLPVLKSNTTKISLCS
jgi:hypothetical protein